MKDKLLYVSSPWGRIPYIILTAVLIWGLITGEGNLSVLAVVLLLICFMGVLYTEAWVFDNNKKKITSYFGVFPIIKRHAYSYDDIAALQITHFIKGLMPTSENSEEDHSNDNKKRKRGQKPMVVFEIDLQSEAKTVPIEIIEESKSGGRTESDAQNIATYSQLHLKVDRAPQKGPTMSIRDLPRGFNKR